MIGRGHELIWKLREHLSKAPPHSQVAVTLTLLPAVLSPASRHALTFSHYPFPYLQFTRGRAFMLTVLAWLTLLKIKNEKSHVLLTWFAGTI